MIIIDKRFQHNKNDTNSKVDLHDGGEDVEIEIRAPSFVGIGKMVSFWRDVVPINHTRYIYDVEVYSFLLNLS